MRPAGFHRSQYRFQPDSFEVRHVRAPGQIDIDLDLLLKG
jgi:hypothetical protein